MKRAVGGVIFLCALFATCLASSKWNQTNEILNLPNQPIKISDLSCIVRAKEYVEDNFSISFKYGNIAEKTIIAAEFRILLFDVFNKPLDSFSIYMIDEDLAPKGEGKDRQVYGIRSSYLVYKAIAYVSKVRFADGKVWEANYNEISTLLSGSSPVKIDRSFIEGVNR